MFLKQNVRDLIYLLLFANVMSFLKLDSVYLVDISVDYLMHPKIEMRVQNNIIIIYLDQAEWRNTKIVSVHAPAESSKDVPNV